MWILKCPPAKPLAKYSSLRLRIEQNTTAALNRNALVASILIALGNAVGLSANAQTSLPTLGDSSDLTTSAERRLGDRIIRELYRDPDYVDDPVVADYVQGI